MTQSSDTVTFFVNDQELTVPKGTNIIEATDAAGITVPRFCYHEKLSVAANCRMCLVEVEKMPKPVPACATPVGDGMKIYTKSPAAIAAQQGVMEFLLINHPLDCPICDEGGECELQDTALGFGSALARYSEDKRVVKSKDIGPLISTEMTRCIHCTRCIRFGQEVGGIMEMGATGRGEHTKIETFLESSIDSELSGNMIDLCPVGALTSKPFRYTARSWELTRLPSIAPHDCVGSNIEIHSVNNEVKRCVPRANSEINDIWISDRDRFSYVGLNSKDRLGQPLVKQNGQWVETDWKTALEVAANGIKNSVEKYSGSNFGAFASPTSTTEEFYLLQKLMRGLGSPHIESRLRRLDFSGQDSEPMSPGAEGAFVQLRSCNAALLVGSNLRKDQPLMNHWLRQAVVNNAASVSLINQVDYTFNFPVSQAIITHPLALVSHLAGVCKSLLDKSGDSLPGHLTSALTSVSPSEQECAIASTLLDADKPVIVLGNAAASHPQYSQVRTVSRLIAALCEGQLIETVEANQVGAYLAGAVPHRLPGGRIPEKKGLSGSDMIAKGLKACVLLGVEPGYDFADSRTAIESFGRSDFVVSLTAYDTPCLRACADVMLPVAPFAETPGTFVNIESRWQSFNSVVLPYGEARPAWKVMRVLGNMLDLPGFGFSSAQQVLEELREQFESSEECTDVVDAVNPLPSSDTGQLYRVFDYPNYGADAIVRRSTPLQETADCLPNGVYVSPDTAEALGLFEDQPVKATQCGATITLPLKIDGRLPQNSVLIPSAVTGAGASLGPNYGEIALEGV